MKIKYFVMSTCMGMFFLLTNSFALAQWGQPSKSEVKEYIETFINVGLYAVPYSEPLSVLLSSPDITRLGLHTWVNAKLQKAWIDYDDALDQGANKEELTRLMDKANRYQAIYTCLFQNDCTRLKQIEARDVRKEQPQTTIYGRCKLVAGTWRWFNGQTVHIGDGVCHASGGNKGIWKCKDPDGVIEIRWKKGGWIDTLRLSSDGKKLEGSNQTGNPVWGKR